MPCVEEQERNVIGQGDWGVWYGTLPEEEVTVKPRLALLGAASIGGRMRGRCNRAAVEVAPSQLAFGGHHSLAVAPGGSWWLLRSCYENPLCESHVRI